jgi:septal ring factor EnvC (AmiA/AmiB activator)
MDANFWMRQWGAFLAAPVPTLLFLALGAIAAWWFRGAMDDGEIRGLKAQVQALEERLRLAADRAQQLTDTKQQIEADLQKLQEQIETGASAKALETTAASAKANLQLLGKREHELRLALDQSQLKEALHNIRARRGLRTSDRITVWDDGSVTDESGGLLGNVYDEI